MNKIQLFLLLSAITLALFYIAGVLMFATFNITNFDEGGRQTLFACWLTIVMCIGFTIGISSVHVK